ncbi:serine protease inhibitor 2-like [Anopheles maculipalpis]|uniref:serine protease inhibitor 2-like n=1 Tax=Anopheles maculipalpis TaxID=1496333 RepID=UPI002158FF5D|nr:serine protease inhibitor 2-like [Anopheles maculipalpis]XP_050074758.1 serine protease inhibitor 2-like [Anopheles maculipalpis]
MRSVNPNSIRCYAALMLLISIGTVHTFRRQHHRPQSSFVSRNDFDWRLAREVFQHESSNVVFSPFSIKLLLTLLYEAAEPGTATHTQLEAALCDPDLNRTRAFYTQFLDTSAQTNGDYEFDIGTKMFLDKAHGKLPQTYTDLLEATYRTSLDRVSFNGTKVTTDRINNWCEKVTRGRITELVTEDMIQDAELILANVLFLKASWKNSFPDDQTHNRTFHVADGETVTAEFMNQMDLYDYTDHEQLGAEVLRLPYKGRQFSMNMVLPHRNVSLAALTESLTPTMLDSIAQTFVREEVTVVIPKFRFNYGTLLNEAIQSLGISDIFTQSAALPLLSPADEQASNGTSKNKIQVSKMLQKAGIEINEKGTLAFAATEIQLVNKFGYDGEPIVFEASRPFLFYILDEETNALLFVGKVTNPTQSTP